MLANHRAERAGPVSGSGHPDQPDVAHGVQAGVAPDRGLDDIGANVDGPDAFGTGPLNGQPPGGDVAGDPASTSAAWSVARVDRQYRLAGLRSGPMAGGETWREVAPDVAQAASGGRCCQRHDRGTDPDGSGRRRSVPGRPAARSD